MEFLDRSLRELFIDLHRSGLWPDPKAISDSVLLAPAEEIRAAYAEAKRAGAVDLAAFYERYFRPVNAPSEHYRTNPEHGPVEHLAAVWEVLKRPADDPDTQSTRYPLPHPYVVVGGRFQEAYYWDSYFTQLGLLVTGQYGLVRNMLDNFAHVIGDIGHIPNGFRSYFLTRSQPPFFPSMVRDYGRATGDLAGAYATYLPAMEAEYRYFMTTPRNLDGLGRYWDDAAGPRIEMYGADLEMEEVEARRPGFFRDLRAACESGWDFSSRWFADPMDLATVRTTQIWPVDLNAILAVNEEILSEASRDSGRARSYAQAAEARRAALRDRFWDDDLGYFVDILAPERRRLPNVTAAGLFPLWAGAATQDQAERAAACMEAVLLAPGGLLTTPLETGQQWDAPNGWAPLQWIAIRGLQRYGLDSLAEELRTRWIATCDAVYRRSGKFVEKYDVRSPGALSGGGEYALQDGFGWTNGVYLDLVADGSSEG